MGVCAALALQLRGLRYAGRPGAMGTRAPGARAVFVGSPGGAEEEAASCAFLTELRALSACDCNGRSRAKRIKYLNSERFLSLNSSCSGRRAGDVRGIVLGERPALAMAAFHRITES